MDKKERDCIKIAVKYNQKCYLDTLNNASHMQMIQKKFQNFNNKFKRFLRCECFSNNALKQIPHLSALIWNMQEFQKQLHVEIYDFSKELSVVNQYLKVALERLADSKYNSKCPSYGEALLNCYLDLYITFTMRGTQKQIDAHPDFLINPLTGSLLELDVLFEKFRLAFEFQGEHHYTDSSTQNKDSIKRNLSITNGHVLVPVNISQLSHSSLSTLICNSIIEQNGLSCFVRNFDNTNLNKKVIHQLYKVIQRMYLAHLYFNETLEWLDNKALIYIRGRMLYSPISSQTVAPRINHTLGETDFNIEELYKKIPQLRKNE
jgi:hypothetical protein